MLALLDTATGELAPLQPRDPGRLSMYVCGPTVAGSPHLGHARFTLAWDAFRRYLTWSGWEVRFVSNVTDIDDKIIARAAEEHLSTEEVSARYEALWWQMMGKLGVERPDSTPHATAYVDQMVVLVQDLLARGHAYQGGDGVYFSTESVPSYGLLARQDLAFLRAGARVEASEEAGKRSPLDFVLWKLVGACERAPAWPSPWGPGRPGWHTECVVMSLDLLGEGFDLHLGGLDLAFPHHENERAQAVAAGKQFARRWAHNGMVLDEQGEKMSRSVGNVMSLPGLLERYEGRVLRSLVLGTHYRSPLSVTQETLDNAAGVLSRLDNFAREVRGLPAPPGGPDAAVLARFRWRLDDDFDTPGAMAVLLGAVRDARAHPERAPALSAGVRECCEKALGLDLAFEEETVDETVAALVRRRDA
ncbi:MAG TPA: cysteine--tRNA ligase, partial [Acidimicrobiales bacterium]|nr:cysteine--tRNA ligase [Acidimicrobiales bacterium]